MIRCQECKEVSKRKEKTYLAVLKERNVEYKKNILNKSHKKIIVVNAPKYILDALLQDGYKISKTLTYKGSEIVKVKRICKNCVSKFKKVL